MGALRVPHEPASAGAVRRRLLCELATRGLPGTLLDDVALVVSELVGNAVRHGAPLPDGGVLVTWSVDGAVLRLEVRDGGGIDTSTADGGPPRPVPTTAEGGRGLAIVQTVASRYTTAVEDGCTCVSAEVPVAAAPRSYARA